MSTFWDEKYRGDSYLYGEKPNEFFSRNLPQGEPGSHPKILLPMEGEGRNAVHAAQKGWHVDAYDSSKAARDKAMKLAGSAGVSISYTLHDVTSLTLAGQKYHAAALIYAHLDPTERQTLHRKVMDALVPGGLLILEAFHISQLEKASGGPGDPAKLYTAEIIRTDFSGMAFYFLEEMETFLEEGTGHNGRASVVRALARKELQK